MCLRTQFHLDEKHHFIRLLTVELHGKDKEKAGLPGLPIKPKFQRVTQSILLIPKGIAKNSACGYWEHPQQFVSPGLHGRRIRHLLESRFRRLLGLVRFERISHSRPAGQLLE